MIWAGIKKILTEEYQSAALRYAKHPPSTALSSTMPKKKGKRSVQKKSPKKAAEARTLTSGVRSVRVNKSTSKIPLIRAAGEHCFWVHEGPILADLAELSDALETMTDVQFRHHVSANRNDFANWIEGVLCDKALAEALRDMRTRGTILRSVKRSLADYDG